MTNSHSKGIGRVWSAISNCQIGNHVRTKSKPAEFHHGISELEVIVVAVIYRQVLLTEFLLCDNLPLEWKVSSRHCLESRGLRSGGIAPNWSHNVYPNLESS